MLEVNQFVDISLCIGFNPPWLRLSIIVYFIFEINDKQISERNYWKNKMADKMETEL